VWSVAANGLWPQTIAVLGIALTAWAAAHQKWWAVGLGGVLLLWARPHAAVIVAILGLALAWRERRVGIALRVGTPGLVSLVFLSLWTKWVYGSWDVTALYGAGSFSEVDKSLVDVENQLGMWVSPDRGILVFTPVLLLLLPALVRSWRTLPRWSTTLLLSGLAYTLLQGALIGFTGGDPIYGYRYGLEFLACATPAFALAAPHVGRVAGRLLAPVLGLQLVVILLGAVLEQIALPFTQAWTHNAFVEAVTGAPVLIPSAVLLVVAVVTVSRGLPGATAAPATEAVPRPVVDALS
jgi:alpha-1,2-mannosyltransferase